MFFHSIFISSNNSFVWATSTNLPTLPWPSWCKHQCSTASGGIDSDSGFFDLHSGFARKPWKGNLEKRTKKTAIKAAYRGSFSDLFLIVSVSSLKRDLLTDSSPGVSSFPCCPLIMESNPYPPSPPSFCLCRALLISHFPD